jgi:uncharacterized protein
MKTDFNPMLLDFDFNQTLMIAAVFVWTGFVRTGLGFGGAALGLPLMLLVRNDPRLWLPIICVHLLFFSGATLRTRLHNVDWTYLQQSSPYIMPPAIVGVFGLVNLPIMWLNSFIYAITLVYGLMWLFNRAIESHYDGVDKLLLIVGGYVSGTSLSGAPLLVAVYMRHVSKAQLRDTLFLLWFVLVAIKLLTFIALSVDIHVQAALTLIPVAAIGHVLGLRAYGAIARNEGAFKRWLGGGLVVISMLGFFDLGISAYLSRLIIALKVILQTLF